MYAIFTSGVALWAVYGMMIASWPILIANCLTLLLAGAGVHRYAVMRRPAGVEEYHRRVREAAAAIPRHIDGWVGEDTPVPAQAIRVLDPNVIISRRYLNVETKYIPGTDGQTVFVKKEKASR